MPGILSAIGNLLHGPGAAHAGVDAIRAMQGVGAGARALVHQPPHALLEAATNLAGRHVFEMASRPTMAREALGAFGNAALSGLRDVATHAGKLHIEQMMTPTHNPLHAFLGNTAAVVGGAALLGAGSMVMDTMALNTSYRQMLQIVPELQREQPERVKMYFDAIAQGSPDTAKQPLVVGTLIKRMLNYDGFDPSTYRELLATHATVSKGRSESMKNVFGIAKDTLGSLHNYGIGAGPR